MKMVDYLGYVKQTSESLKLAGQSVTEKLSNITCCVSEVVPHILTSQSQRPYVYMGDN